MHRVIQIAGADTVPEVDLVLMAQGVPSTVDPGERIRHLAEESIAVYERLARPIGIIRVVEPGEFADIYQGEGDNEAETPLGGIFEKANHLALFAVTVGERPGAEIARLFDTNDFAAGAMLDAAASEGTELTADAMEQEFINGLLEQNKLDSTMGVLRFSPGYCGWHVSAQRKLFAKLEPDKIGIGLTPSHLMHPLKSISGVIVAGDKRLLEFGDDFPFCESCDDHACRDRLDAVMTQEF